MSMGGPLEDAVSGVSDKIVAALLPKLTPIVEQAAQASEPMIRTVLQEDVVPQVGTWVVVGMAAVAAVSAFVGVTMAKRASR